MFWSKTLLMQIANKPPVIKEMNKFCRAGGLQCS